MGEPCQKYVKQYDLNEDFKIWTFWISVFQNLCGSLYCFGDMKELKRKNTHVLKYHLNELKFNIEPYMKT